MNSDFFPPAPGVPGNIAPGQRECPGAAGNASPEARAVPAGSFKSFRHGAPGALVPVQTGSSAFPDAFSGPAGASCMVTVG